MKRALLASTLLLLCSAALGATVFREQVAQAAQAILPVRVTNAADEPVPVREQGTVDVNVSESTPLVGGGYAMTLGSSERDVGFTATATALSIRMSAGTNFVQLSGPDGIPALLYGPGFDGNFSIVLALSRPIRFDHVQCSGDETARCSVSWIGARTS
jgi:hypothetical protein